MKNMHHATHLPLELGCSQVHTPLENVCTDRKANDPNLWPPCNTLITNKKSYPIVVPQIWNVPFSSRTDDDSIESFFPPYLILAPSLNYRRFENVFTRDRWLQKLFSSIASFFLNRGFSINCLRFQRRLTQFFFFFHETGEPVSILACSQHGDSWLIVYGRIISLLMFPDRQVILEFSSFLRHSDEKLSP